MAGYIGHWVASGQQPENSRYMALMKYRKQKSLGSFVLERMTEQIEIKNGMWTITTHAPGHIRHRRFRFKVNEKKATFDHHTFFARDGFIVHRSTARLDKQEKSLVITAMEEGGVRFTIERRISNIKDSRGDVTRKMEKIISWEPGVKMANGSSTDPVAIRICFVESKGDTAFDSIRGLGAAVLGGVVLGPPGMVAAGVSYLALRKSNILKGPDAEKFESLMARKEQLDKRLEKNQIDMETIKKAATRAKSTTSSQLRQTNSEIVKAAAASADERNATSSFVGFAKAFLENNEAIDELAAQVKKDTGTRKKLSASEESGISAKLDLLLKRMDDLELKLKQGLQGVEDHLERQDVLLQGIGGDIQRTLRVVYRVNNIVGALAHDELAHPRLVILLPPKKAKTRLLKTGQWFSPKYWLKQELRVHILCAHSLQPVALTDGGDGYELLKPKEWLIRAAPAVKATITVLRVALIAARVCSGLPLPIPEFDLGADDEKLEAFSDALRGLGSAIDGVLDKSDPAMKAGLEPLDRVHDSASVESLTAAEQNTVRQVTAQSYRALGEWLNVVDPNLRRLPMKKATSPDGHIDWVANIHAAAWESGVPYIHPETKQDKAISLDAVVLDDCETAASLVDNSDAPSENTRRQQKQQQQQRKKNSTSRGHQQQHGDNRAAGARGESPHCCPCALS